MDDIARIVFAIAVLGHGVAHLAATPSGRNECGKPAVRAGTATCCC